MTDSHTPRQLNLTTHVEGRVTLGDLNRITEDLITSQQVPEAWQVSFCNVDQLTNDAGRSRVQIFLTAPADPS